jgi:hypothetical protein
MINTTMLLLALSQMKTILQEKLRIVTSICRYTEISQNSSKSMGKVGVVDSSSAMKNHLSIPDRINKCLFGGFW